MLQLRLRTSKKKNVFIYVCIYIYLNITFLIKRGNTLRDRNQNKLAKAKSTPKTNSERETRGWRRSSAEGQRPPQSLRWDWTGNAGEETAQAKKRTTFSTRGDGAQHLHEAKSSACSQKPGWKTSWPAGHLTKYTSGLFCSKGD